MTSEQVVAVVEEIRERVRGRHQKKVQEITDFELPGLDGLGQARDAAQDKVASIGSVNPRPPGLLNSVIQAWKKSVARLLNWFVRDQVEFNCAALRYMDRNIEAAIEQNDNLLRVAKATAGQTHVQDMMTHWKQWRPAMEERLAQMEIHFLHCVREVESGARDRDAKWDKELRKIHQDYRDELRRTADEIQTKLGEDLSRLQDSLHDMQDRFWEDLRRLKTENEHLIHTELRLIRRRASGPGRAAPPASASIPATPASEQASAARPAALDYARFEERFRGDEAYVGESQAFYLPHFKNCRQVVDLGCGRGEFLSLLGEQGVLASGVDADPDAVAACRGKSLDVEQGDLFAFLSSRPDKGLDGIFCAHVVEHLAAHLVPSLIFLANQKLRPGGILAIETPNPACLATFAGDFYLDPTHRRPVPSQQVHFYLQEAGFSDIEVHEIHPAADVFPEIAGLDKVEELRAFRRRFFGGLDYAIIARKFKN